MEFRLPTLGVLRNTTPLLGLLGTITSMIKSFMAIEEAARSTPRPWLADSERR